MKANNTEEGLCPLWNKEVITDDNLIILRGWAT